MLPPDKFTKGVLSTLINKNWTSIQNDVEFVVDYNDLLPLNEIFEEESDSIFERIPEKLHVPPIDLHIDSDETQSIDEYVEAQEDRFIEFFEKKGMMLFDGLHAAASVGSYIYRAKGVRYFLFQDGTLAFCSIHSQIDEYGFSLHHEIIDSAPLIEFQKLSRYWRKLNTLHPPIKGTEDLYFLLYSLTKINVSYRKAFLLEYLVNPIDVQGTSRLSTNIASSLWNTIFKYILESFSSEKIEEDKFLDFVLRFMKSVEVIPSNDDLLLFFKDILTIKKEGQSISVFAEQINKIVGILEKNFDEPVKNAKETIIAFKNFVERQASKDFYFENNPQENICRLSLQSFLGKRSYREVPVRGGRTDILVFDNGGRFLYETKIWRGRENYEQGKREIEEYILGEDDDGGLQEIFYVVFDPTKSNQAAAFIGNEITQIKIGDKRVLVIVINIALPIPSKKPAT